MHGGEEEEEDKAERSEKETIRGVHGLPRRKGVCRAKCPKMPKMPIVLLVFVPS